MASFVALYRGPSLPAAELLAVSTDPALVAEVAGVLLEDRPEGNDPAIAALHGGRRRALRLVRKAARGRGR